MWERGLAQSPPQRALTLLALACADDPIEQLAHWSVGRRDTHLLALREQTFGPQLASIAACPACGERLEFRIAAADIRATPATEPEETLAIAHADFDVRFRLPNSLDLASLDPAADAETNRRNLLNRCVVAARHADATIATAELPGDLVTAMAQRMAEADPRADVQVALDCPQCRHAWQAPLDIVSYFWTEIHAWAGRILREVHALASAYGWREADVLALTPGRRQAYLEMIEP